MTKEALAQSRIQEDLERQNQKLKDAIYKNASDRDVIDVEIEGLKSEIHIKNESLEEKDKEITDLNQNITWYHE